MVGMIGMIGALCTSGCYTYSSMQSARLVPPGQVELVPSVSTLAFHDKGESNDSSTNFGLQVGMGHSLNVNGRFRSEWIEPEGKNVSGYAFVSYEAKFALVRDHLAGGVALGTFVGEDVSEPESIQIHPSFYGTIPLAPNSIELNLGPKYLWFIDTGSDDLAAFNVGLGLSSDLRRWSVRPEVGWLWSLDDDGHYVAWTLGFAFTPGW